MVITLFYLFYDKHNKFFTPTLLSRRVLIGRVVNVAGFLLDGEKESWCCDWIRIRTKDCDWRRIRTKDCDWRRIRTKDCDWIRMK